MALPWVKCIPNCAITLVATVVDFSQAETPMKLAPHGKTQNWIIDFELFEFNFEFEFACLMAMFNAVALNKLV